MKKNILNIITLALVVVSLILNVVMVFSVVGAFTTLALMRLFINMYLPLNPQKGEKCNFHKGGKNA